MVCASYCLSNFILGHTKRFGQLFFVAAMLRFCGFSPQLCVCLFPKAEHFWAFPRFFFSPIFCRSFGGDPSDCRFGLPLCYLGPFSEFFSAPSPSNTLLFLFFTYLLTAIPILYILFFFFRHPGTPRRTWFLWSLPFPGLGPRHFKQMYFAFLVSR